MSDKNGDWKSTWNAGPEPVGAEVGLRLREVLGDLFEVHDVTIARGGLLTLRGRLLVPAHEAYGQAKARLQPLGYTPLFRRQGQDDIIQAVPRLLSAGPSRNWLGFLLLGLTVLSMLFAGLLVTGWDMRGMPLSLLAGLPYAATLLAILGAHELGHYIVGRHYGVPLSLPYFIPMPFNIFGTMGAVIRLKAPTTNRRVLLALAVAGPLSGLAVGLPLLVLGLKLSTVAPITPGGAIEGNSILYAAVKLLMFGRLLPGGGQDVYLHPVALAAWGGLFITGLNLIPAGQLDGGHVLYVLIGERARRLTPFLAGALVVLGLLYWPGWFLWAALIFAFGQAFAVSLDEITPLEKWQVALAVAMLVLFVLIFTPIPMRPS